MEIFVLGVLTLVVIQISDVEAATRDSDIIGMAVAGCVSFMILSVVITIVVVSFQWKNWFNNWMRLKGKTRMSRAYFKKKKEARKRLISGSVASRTSQINGVRPSPSVVRTDTLVEDWRQRARNLPPRRVYEEKDATIELGEEFDNEFTIETEVLDDVPIIRHQVDKNRHGDHEVFPVSQTYELVDNWKPPEQKREENVADVYSSPVKTASIRVSPDNVHELHDHHTSTTVAVPLVAQPGVDTGIENPLPAIAAIMSATEDKKQSDNSSSSSSSSSQEEKITSF